MLRCGCENSITMFECDEIISEAGSLFEASSCCAASPSGVACFFDQNLKSYSSIAFVLSELLLFLKPLIKSGAVNSHNPRLWSSYHILNAAKLTGSNALLAHLIAADSNTSETAFLLCNYIRRLHYLSYGLSDISFGIALQRWSRPQLSMAKILSDFDFRSSIHYYKENGWIKHSQVISRSLLQRFAQESFFALKNWTHYSDSQPTNGNELACVFTGRKPGCVLKNGLYRSKIVRYKKYEPSTAYFKSLFSQILNFRYQIPLESYIEACSGFGSYAELIHAELFMTINASDNPKSNYEASQQAQMWHADYHGSSFAKVFIPLTELNDELGTHRFASATHLRKPPFYSDKRYEDHEISSHFSEDCLVAHEANPGDIIIENTNGLHKGVPGRNSFRLMLILTFNTGLILL